MAGNRDRVHKADEESSFLGEEEYEECPVCHQEFADGVCPIVSAECPYLVDDEDDDEDEDDAPDFDDVDNLDAVLDKDEEADRLTEEEGDIPAEDLKDDADR